MLLHLLRRNEESSERDPCPELDPSGLDALTPPDDPEDGEDDDEDDDDRLADDAGAEPVDESPR